MRERKDFEEQCKSERARWNVESSRLERRIRVLEEAEERREKALRKNNIAIKGNNWHKDNVEESVKAFVSEKLDEEVEVKRAWKVERRSGGNIVVAELGNWQQKRKVMVKKKSLVREIWVEDDLTRKEREIQQRLRERARAEKEKGDQTVRVGYHKIFLRGKWRSWREVEHGEEVRRSELARDDEENV